MPKKPLSQVEAVRELYFAFAATKRSKAALARLRRACESLGLDEEATRHAEYLADYRPRPDDEVYAPYR